MKRALSLMMLLLLSLPLFACSKGEECHSCSQDSDCKDAFVCSRFSDGSQRCGTGTGATTCRVRS